MHLCGWIAQNLCAHTHTHGNQSSAAVRRSSVGDVGGGGARTRAHTRTHTSSAKIIEIYMQPRRSSGQCMTNALCAQNECVARPSAHRRGLCIMYAFTIEPELAQARRTADGRTADGGRRTAGRQTVRQECARSRAERVQLCKINATEQRWRARGAQPNARGHANTERTHRPGSAWPANCQES